MAAATELLSTSFKLTLLIMLIIINTCATYVGSSENDNDNEDYLRLSSNNCKAHVSAVLLECPRELGPRHEGFHDNDNENNKNKKSCERQMMVNVRVNPSFHVKKLDKFLILDEIYHPRRRSKAKIMSPYLIELSRGEPIMMYPLEFSKNVEAFDQDSNNRPMSSNSDYPESKCDDNDPLKKNENMESTQLNVHNVFITSTEMSTEPTIVSRAEESTSCGSSYRDDHNSVSQYEDESYKRILEKINHVFNGVSKFDDNPAHTTESKWNSNYRTQKSVKINVQSTSASDDVTAGVGLEESLAKQLRGKRLAQLGLVMPHRKSRKTNDIGQLNDISNLVDTFTETYADYHDINNIEQPAVPNNDNEAYAFDKGTGITANGDSPNRYDECQEKVIQKIDHPIKKRTKLDSANGDLSDAPIYDESLLDYNIGKNSNDKTIFKSCECKQADVDKELHSDFDRNGKDDGGFLSPSLDMNINDVDENVVNTNQDEYDRQFSDLLQTKDNSHDIPSDNFAKTLRRLRHSWNLKNAPQDMKKIFKKSENEKQHEIKSTEYSRSNRKVSNDLSHDDDSFYVNMAAYTYSPKSDDINMTDEYSEISSLKSHNEKLYKPLMPFNSLKFLETSSTTEDSNELLRNPIKQYFTTDSDTDRMSDVPTTSKIMPQDFKDFLYSRKMFSYTEPTISENQRQEKILENENPKEAFANVFEGLNLNIPDKYELLDPLNESANERLAFDKLSADIEKLSNDMPKSLPHHLKSSPYPLWNKQKRSFLFYDDMEMPENNLGNEAFYDHTLPVLSNVDKDDLSIDEDVQPCATCGGKGRKTKLPKTSLNVLQDDSYGKFKLKSCNCKRDASINDAWYSVFNISAPLPYLTTKVSIFRKRQETWWRIVPSITLSSLSDVFANENLSILFSSHVDIFQFEKSLNLHNNQLLIPKNERHTRNLNENNALNIESSLNIKPENLWAVKPDTLKTGKLVFKRQSCNHFHKVPTHKMTNHTKDDNVVNEKEDDTMMDNSDNAGIKKVLDFGYFPTTMNVVQHCPNNKQRLCLNMLEDKVPAFTIKIKMPFRENNLIYEHLAMIKIVKIMTDATRKDALLVTVDVINYGPQVSNVTICLLNCPTRCIPGGKSQERNSLIPHLAKTVTFNLPFVTESHNGKHKKIQCDVVVKVPVALTEGSDIAKTEDSKNMKRFSSIETKQKIIAKREMDVESGNRCLCVWKCRCHCMPKLETHVDFNICQELDEKAQRNAGLLDDYDDNYIDEEVPQTEPPPSTETPNYETVEAPPAINSPNDVDKSTGSEFFLNALLLFLLMLLLGLIKATLGLFIKSIDKCGYNYVQPGRKYKCSSQPRRFCVNTCFFIIFPFLFWCTCFIPSEEDCLAASTEWLCSNEQEPKRKYSSRPRTPRKVYKLYKVLETNDENDDDRDGDADSVLSEHIEVTSQMSRRNHRGRGGLDVPSLHGISDVDLNDDIFDIDLDDDDDDEANTKFVLKALAESRESLRRLSKTTPSRNININEINDKECTEDNELAEEFVNKLKGAQIVYRTFDQPIGNLQHIPPGFKYCIQGYFLPRIGLGYEFVNYNPLGQHRCPSMNGRTMIALRPPVLLCPKDFSRIYNDKHDVYKAGDLSTQPPDDAPCINVSTMSIVATSVAQVASEGSFDNAIKPNESQISRYKSPLSSSTVLPPVLLQTSRLQSNSFGRNSSTNPNINDTNVIQNLRSPRPWIRHRDMENQNNDAQLSDLDIIIPEMREYIPRNIHTIPE